MVLSHALYRQSGFSHWQGTSRVITAKTYNKQRSDDRNFNWLLLMPKGATLQYGDDWSSHLENELLLISLCLKLPEAIVTFQK